jgi:hypothetical protein
MPPALVPCGGLQTPCIRVSRRAGVFNCLCQSYGVMPNQVQEVLADPVAVRLLSSANPARLAYNALDRTPRVIPVGFFWDGRTLVIGTVPGSAKVRALTANPSVALTIDTSPPTWPPNVLLLRGTASVELVEGVFDEYVEAGKKLTPRAEWAGWEAGVRALYSEMVRIDITLTWAKIHDFERRIPQAVEELATKRFGPLPT